MEKSVTDNKIVNIECRQNGLDEAIEKVSRLNELLEAVAKHRNLLALVTLEERSDDADSRFQFFIREEKEDRVFNEFDSTSKEKFLQRLGELIGPHTTFVEVKVQNCGENLKHVPHGMFGPDDWRQKEMHMTIIEALNSRTKEKPFIARKSWSKFEQSFDIGNRRFLRPSNSPDGCIYYSCIDSKPCPRWWPAEEDLLATDWELIALDIFSIERL